MSNRGHWLAKSEPETYSIHDLERDGRTAWEGVRNYMARNYLRQMKAGDRVLFYHSNASPSGVAGVAEVVREAYPDLTALDPRSDYHDPGATEADPRWSLVDVGFVEAWPVVLPLEALKADPALDGMEVTRRGSRLSVSPVSAEHFARVVAMAAEIARAPAGEAPVAGKKKAAAPAKKEKPAARASKKKPIAKQKPAPAKKKPAAKKKKKPVAKKKR